jgi:hypothetical protein
LKPTSLMAPKNLRLKPPDFLIPAGLFFRRL